MTPRAFLIGILIPSFCLAQVQITEISPTTVGEEKEWFEFTISTTEETNLSEWKISNGTTQKRFTDHVQKLTLHSGGTLDDTLLFVPNEEEAAYFSWSPSPLSLPNGGGTLQLRNETDELLDEVVYPDTKSGTKSGFPYGEVWNRRTGTDEVFPLVYRSSGEASFRHSRGFANFSMPSLPDEIEIVINEVSPDGDFVELRIVNAPKDANLKYMKLKKKSSPRTVLFQDTDWIVETGDLIVIDVDGLSGGSETFEIILYAGTSWEVSEDFLCWQNGKMSQGVEKERVKKVGENAWSGDCVQIENHVQNESLARDGSDSGTKEDFLRHFLGSKDAENTFPNTANQAPKAKFLVQGGAKIHETSLNLTGFDGTTLTSTDSNGAFDLKSYSWTVAGKSCGDYIADKWEWGQTRNGRRTCAEESVRSNPDRIYFNFEEKSSFSVSLTVEDYSGGTHTFTEALTKDPFQVAAGGSAPSAFNNSLKKWITKELTAAPRNTKLKEGDVGDDFFDDFLATLDMNKISPSGIYWDLDTHPDFSTFAPIVEEIKRKPLDWPLFEKERFSDNQKKKIAKNLGLIFLEPYCWS